MKSTHMSISIIAREKKHLIPIRVEPFISNQGGGHWCPYSPNTSDRNEDIIRLRLGLDRLIAYSDEVLPTSLFLKGLT